MNLINKIYQKRSLRDYGISVGSQGLSRLLALSASVFIARMLSPENFGIYSLFYAVFILIYQTQSGINIAYVRFSKINKSNNKVVVLRITVLLQLLLSFFVIIGGWPLALLLSRILSLENPWVLFFGFLSGGFISIFNLWFGVFQEREDFGRLGLCVMTFNLLTVLLLTCIWIIKRDLTVLNVLLLYVGLSGLMGVFSSILLWAETQAAHFDKALFFDIAKMTVMNMAVTLSYFLYRFFDIFFIKYYLELGVVGIYSAALRTSMLLSILASAMSTVLLPKASEGVDSIKDLRNYLVESYTLAFPVVVLFGVFFLISPLVLGILYGEKYITGSSILRILILCWCINVLYIPIMQIFYAMNKVGLRLAVEIFKLVISLLLFIVLIPRFGAIGSAWSLLIAISLSFVLGTLSLAVVASRRYSLKPLKYSTGRF